MKISKVIILFTMFFSGFAMAVDSDATRTNSSVLPKPGPITNSEQLKPHFGLLAGSVHPEGSYDPGIGYDFEITLHSA
jgi:hypothetical protein